MLPLVLENGDLTEPPRGAGAAEIGTEKTHPAGSAGLALKPSFPPDLVQ